MDAIVSPESQSVDRPGTRSEVHPAQSTALMANAIRALSMDAVQQANSGHPGAPMGMAEIAVALWGRHLRHSPKNPRWPGRDRFVLSNGHGSMLLYSLLHLTGYDLALSELRSFRQLHSKTPGHPEFGITPGVETTTGPLGQGLANAVGMALAETLLAESHVAVHTWPELGAATLDVYVCNLGADNSRRAEALLATLSDAFAPTSVERHALERGALPSRVAG